MKPPLLALIGLGLPLALMIALSGMYGRPGAASPATASSPAGDAAHRPRDSQHLGQPSPTTRPVPMALTALPLEAIAPHPALRELLDAAAGWLDAAPAEPASRVARAGRYLEEGDYLRAVRAFDRLLIETPSDPAVLLGKGMALAGLGRHADALPLFESALEHDPHNAAAAFNRAVMLARLNQPDQAITALRELLHRWPQHERARFNLAALLHARGEHRVALDVWREVTAAGSTAPRGGGAAHSSAGGADTASVGAHELPRLPRGVLAQAWSHRGECAMALNLPVEAQTCYAQVIRLEPADARAWLNLGIAQAAAGDRSAAIASLEKCLQLDGRLVPALNQLAYVHATLYRDVGDERHRAAAVTLAERSLAIASAQPNIRALRDALRRDPQE